MPADNTFKALMIGDVYGESGLGALLKALPILKARYGADFVVVNGENASEGFGLTADQARQMLDAGVDVITSGNHIWQGEDIMPMLDSEPRLLRPMNYGDLVEGHGFVVHKGVCVINLQGRIHMSPIDEPVASAEKALAEISGQAKTVLVDFHGEVPEEKEAVAFALDGRITAFVGTHTHVQTADERILDNGTAYITDIGMTGPAGGIIGSDPSIAMEKMLSQVPLKNRPASGTVKVCGVCITSDRETGKASSIERFRI